MPRKRQPLAIGNGPLLWELWRSCFRLAPRLVYILGAWIVAGGVVQVLLVLPSAELVNLVAARAPGASLSSRQLLPPVGALCALIALSGVARLGVYAYSWRLGRMFNGFLRAQTMRAVSLPPELSHLEDPAARARLNEAAGVGPSRYNPGGAIVRTSYRAMFVLQTLTSVLVLCWNVPLAGLIVAITMLACQRLFARSLASYALELISHAGEFKRVDYLRSMLWQSSSARELRVFDMWPWLRGQADSAWQGVADRLSAHHRAARRTAVVAGLIFTLGFGGAFALTILSWSDRTLTLEASVISLQVMVFLAVALCRTVVDTDQSVELGVRALPAAAELVRSAESSRSAVLALVAESTPHEPAGLTCAGLTFSYPWGDGTPILRDLTLSVSPGEHIGIVGLNGAGKSTFLKIVCGFYQTQPGQVHINGVDLCTLDRSAWQRRIAVVHQDFVRYPRSLLFNVAVGRNADRSLVLECLVDAGLSKLAERLPDGLDTSLVIGSDLSGGQWQRVAIARALYRLRTGARLLILDEPIANLDPSFEPAFAKLVAEQAAGITTLTVSHRLSLVRSASKIVVLEGGRITESGTHDQLSESSGLYASLFRIQASGWVQT